MTTATPETEAPPEPATPLVERPVAMFTLIAIALVATAGTLGLFEPTETRYAEIAREMHATGDYWIPRLDGIAHFHKPPFAYWAAAFGMTLFGENSWGARLPVAAATLCTYLFTWRAIRRRFGELVSARSAVWVLATMALPFALGRSLATDPFLAAAVAGFWALAPSPAAIALIGLGFFIKGPVVFVLTALPVLAAAAWGRSRETLRLLGPASGWLWFVVLGLPWFLYVVARVPGLLGYLLDDQLWQRFAAHVHHREGPAWYFIAVVAIGALPWTAALAVGLARAWRERASEASRLLLAWAFVPVVFFSFSGSKLPAYVLPCFPAVAALAALGVEAAGRSAWITTGATLGLIAAAGVILGPRLMAARVVGTAASPALLPPLVYVALALWALTALAMVRRRPRWATPMVLAGWVALLIGLGRYEGPLGSPRPLVNLLEENRGPGEPVVEYRAFNAGLPFYLREPVRLLDVERELFFTPVDARTAAFVTRDSLAPMVARHGRVWLLAPGKSGESLADSLGLTFRPTSTWRHETLGFLEASGPARALPYP